MISNSHVNARPFSTSWDFYKYKQVKQHQWQLFVKQEQNILQYLASSCFLHVSGEWPENICITHNRKTLLCTTDCDAEPSRVGGKANAVCLVAPRYEGVMDAKTC